MRIAAYVFLALFIVATVLELVFCFFVLEKARKITKPFCVFFLAIAAALTIPDQPLVWVAALFGVLGDVLLIFVKNDKLFAAGAVSFLVGHLLYFSQVFLMLDGNVEWWFYLLYILSVAVIALILAKPLGSMIKDKVLLTGALVYGAFLASGLIVMGVCVGYFPTSYMYLSLIGYVFFIMSDLTLAYTRFKRDIPRRDFPIMLTYLLAEFLIVAGFVLTALNPA